MIFVVLLNAKNDVNLEKENAENKDAGILETEDEVVEEETTFGT